MIRENAWGRGNRREIHAEKANKARHPLPDRSSPSPALLTRMWHLRGWCLVIAGLINIPRYASWRWTPCQCRPPFHPRVCPWSSLLSLSVTGSQCSLMPWGLYCVTMHTGSANVVSNVPLWSVYLPLPEVSGSSNHGDSVRSELLEVSEPSGVLQI